MKNFVNRIRKANRRRFTVSLTVAVLFGALNWGLSKLIALQAAGREMGSYDGAAYGYVMGFLISFLLMDASRRAHKAALGRFGGKVKAPAPTE